MKHARLQPSVAHRWTRCPGSVAACADIPDRPNEYSDRGQALHAALASRLQGWGLPFSVKLESGKEYHLTAEDVEAVLLVAAEVDARATYCEVSTEVHEPVGEAFGYPYDLWGTSDVIIDEPERLTVLDAKFGFRRVQAKGNEQLLCYTLGEVAKRKEYAWQEYVLVIVQPGDDEPVREWVLTREELTLEQARLSPLVDRALDLDAPRIPSEEACDGCPFAGQCPELRAHALVLAQEEFSTEPIAPDTLARVLNVAPLAEAAIAAARQEALRRLQAGLDVPGWKLGESRKHRKWRDEEEAVAALEMLGVDPYERKVISPAQAEKKAHLGAKALDGLAPRPPGEPTLVRDTDPRPALPAEFKPVDESDNE